MTPRRCVAYRGRWFEPPAVVAKNNGAYAGESLARIGYSIEERRHGVKTGRLPAAFGYDVALLSSKSVAFRLGAI